MENFEKRAFETSRAEELDRKKRKIERIIVLASELSKSPDSFPFSGLDAASYSKLKASGEEFPGYATPIDELLERFKNEGVKVVFGDHPDSGNVYILPGGSDDVENDSVFPRHLQIIEGMDEKLKELIFLGKS